MAKRTKVKTESGTWVDLASSVTDLSQYYTKTQSDARNGLTSVVPTSVTVGSGSATVNANGGITVGTAVSSITINGAFSAAYDSYKIYYTGGVNSGTSAITFSLSGITTGYYSSLIYTNFGTAAVTPANSSNTSSWAWCGGSSINGAIVDIDIQSPFQTKHKSITAVFNEFGTGSNNGNARGYLPSTASSTGFTLGLASGGALTGGTIRIYGYNNN